ncbi:helix-turn-helix domain-containing protein [Marinobacter daepoensis]|uniref:helix-turn-helix domain-containing protein n=1 Tax=Marinobacter daepoensis TaxID=262077 RepID=UPI001D17278F|nr:helix-turn-helix domain-containing protein [Marinobacter daepoensis]
MDDYIEAYLATPIHLTDLASLANMSGFHFHRMFRLVRGCPPHSWVTTRRVCRARELLCSVST